MPALNGSRGAAQALDAIGHTAIAQGDLEAGDQLEQQALEIFQHLDETDGILSALDGLAVTARKQQDLAAAMAYEQRIVDRLRQLQQGPGPDLPRLAVALGNLGTLCHDLGDETAAAAYLDEAEQVIAAVGDMFGAGLVRLNIAGLANEIGEHGFPIQ
jgi:hypothetical protein